MNGKHKYLQMVPERPSTAVDIYRMLPEGTRCEVIFNELIMSPSPSPLHQLLLSDLHALLYDHLKVNGTGKVLLAPTDVYLEDNDSVVQPDLLVILSSKLQMIKADGIYGAPDVTIEILSTNRAYDTQRKRALYEKAGVKEYFIIDPDNKLVTLLTLGDNGIYGQTYEQTGLLRSVILNCSLNF